MDEVKRKFFKLLNLMPSKGQMLCPKSSKYLETIIQENPSLCKRKYKFDAFSRKAIYPLHMLCALGAPVTVIKACVRGFQEAFDDDSSAIGSPLHFACMFLYASVHGGGEDYSTSSLEVVRYLVESQPNSDRLMLVNKKASQTALHLACIAPRVSGSSLQQEEAATSIVQLLIEKCPKLLIIVDKHRNLPLHMVCKSHRTSTGILQALAAGAPRAAMTHNTEGFTPLHLAVMTKSSSKTLDIIIKANENALLMLDNKKNLPLHTAIASKTNNIKVFKSLIDPYPGTLYVRNKDGELPYRFGRVMQLDLKVLELLKTEDSQPAVFNSSILVSKKKSLAENSKYPLREPQCKIVSAKQA